MDCTIDFYSKLPADAKLWAFELVKNNMEELYDDAGYGWPEDRRDAMRAFVEDNAEATALRDDTFDVTTSIYLLHELPPRARRAVLAELARVTAPGGLVLLMDALMPTTMQTLEGTPALVGRGCYVVCGLLAS